MKVAAERLLEEITSKEIVAEERKLMEEMIQPAQCEEDVQPIHENEYVSETVVQGSSSDEEDSDFDFVRLFAYNSDGEVEL